MTVLIVYGTTRQTRKIADWTAKRARERGHDVELHDIATLPPGKVEPWPND